jgi:serine/threonine protein kinase
LDAFPGDETGLLTGKTLCNRYFLRQFVGSGGTAEVYLAWDQYRSAKMAIKVLRPDVKNHSLQHFEQEAELLSRLEHPFIVRRYELERDGNLIFLVMDWVEGSNLRQRISELKQPFSLGKASEVLNPVCSALNFTHQNGIYHCDIKPANILLHVDGRVLLTDYGVARLADEKRSGGTPAYMAPEQIRDESVDARTDIYALGVTLYEMLSGGKLPFRGDSQSSQGNTPRERVEWEHCYLPPPPLRQYNASLPQPVLDLVDQALSKEPGQRPATVLEFLEVFEQARRLSCGLKQSDNVEILTTILSPALSLPPVSKPVPTPAPPQPVVTGPYLLCTSGQYFGKAVAILNQRISIGRARSSGLWLSERSVSRTHAAIVRTRRAVYIEDEGSTAGTYLNDKRVLGPMKLHHGDVIRIGYSEIFEYHEK